MIKQAEGEEIDERRWRAISEEVFKSEGKTLTIDEEALKGNEKALKYNEKALKGNDKTYLREMRRR